ncbi:helix-turn-helix domain-containing protein [Streptomyces fulvoviolaceus]|uniref:helix-turn-helix domain-containing protein n=1 Tax=Streptomyces fulvoviolaceus TaxID=285535 RepID=UPI0021BE9656|nr:helix-turn-helix transcriptional regulator [Streptomyces fulvoviolaceus]MCT9084107.1 helix-turn-helix domain-containing protein [Streptomyces fulvoviolaceus]
MAVNKNPTVRQRRLGRMLRDLRNAAGMTLVQAAEELQCAESKMSRIEGAQSGIRPLDLRVLLDFYGVHDQALRARLKELARHGRERGWWSQHEDTLKPAYADYIALEWDASDLYVVETDLVPGLLQTPAYTEAIIREQRPDKADDFDYVEELVKVRGQRKQVFARSAPLRLWAIITESSLHHRVGGTDAMREQLDYLATQASETNIQVQVLPSAAAINSALHGPFGILSFPEPAETDVVYADGLIDTVYYEEPEQVKIFTTLFRRLNSEALPVDQSIARIRAAIQEMD